MAEAIDDALILQNAVGGDQIVQQGRRGRAGRNGLGLSPCGECGGRYGGGQKTAPAERSWPTAQAKGHLDFPLSYAPSVGAIALSCFKLSGTLAGDRRFGILLQRQAFGRMVA